MWVLILGSIPVSSPYGISCLGRYVFQYMQRRILKTNKNEFTTRQNTIVFFSHFIPFQDNIGFKVFYKVKNIQNNHFKFSFIYQSKVFLIPSSNSTSGENSSNSLALVESAHKFLTSLVLAGLCSHSPVYPI